MRLRSRTCKRSSLSVVYTRTTGTQSYVHNHIPKCKQKTGCVARRKHVIETRVHDGTRAQRARSMFTFYPDVGTARMFKAYPHSTLPLRATLPRVRVPGSASAMEIRLRRGAHPSVLTHPCAESAATINIDQAGRAAHDAHMNCTRFIRSISSFGRHVHQTRMPWLRAVEAGVSSEP